MEEPILTKKQSLTDKLMKKQNRVLVIAVIAIVTLVVGASYALLTNFDEGSGMINVTSGDLQLSISEYTSINLNDKFPENDTDGLLNSTPVMLSFYNSGSIDIMKYEVKLVDEEGKTSTLNHEYIKYAISENTETNYVVKGTLASSNDLIYTGYNLGAGSTKIIYLKVWISEEAGNNALNKTFNGAIKIEGYQRVETAKNKAIEYISNQQLIQNDTNIKYYEVNGTDNGNGLFLLGSSIGDTYPIYYYRGNVDNNNVYFAENCWKIVRTTSTGGLKLVYNGAATDVDGEKQCLETTGTGTQLSVGTKNFNSSYESPAYVGYSLPESSKRYSYSTDSLSSTIYYGSGVDKTTYKLVDPVLELNDTHHYSYNSTDPDATGISGDTGNVRYYYFKSSASGTSGTGYFIKFDKTKDISTILDEMLSENNSKNNPSIIQGVINTWWGSLDVTYGEYLEDTEWCNDRSIASLGGWSPTGTLYSSNWKDYSIVFNERVRYDQSTFGSDANNIKNTNTPILTCSRPVDRLTVANENLTYPIGLLTYDEVALAGARWSNGNSNFYLYTNQYYWLLSSSHFGNGNADVGVVRSGGALGFDEVVFTYGVRPALSLKSGTQILRGEGTKTKPYIITE